MIIKSIELSRFVSARIWREVRAPDPDLGWVGRRKRIGRNRVGIQSRARTREA
jgi:hypothetical protein